MIQLFIMNLKQGKENQFYKEKFRYFCFRVRLSKRRPVGGGSKPANLRLVQRYRPFVEVEEKNQVRINKRRTTLFPKKEIYSSRENV